MRHLTFPDIFGANATQTATTLTISKSDFPALTASVNNNGEQLLLAILLRLHQTFFEGEIIDENAVPICGKDETSEIFTLVFANFLEFDRLRLVFLTRLAPSELIREVQNFNPSEDYLYEGKEQYFQNGIIRPNEAFFDFSLIVDLPVSESDYAANGDNPFWVKWGTVLSPDDFV